MCICNMYSISHVTEKKIYLLFTSKASSHEKHEFHLHLSTIETPTTINTEIRRIYAEKTSLCGKYLQILLNNHCILFWKT